MSRGRAGRALRVVVVSGVLGLAAWAASPPAWVDELTDTVAVLGEHAERVWSIGSELTGGADGGDARADGRVPAGTVAAAAARTVLAELPVGPPGPLDGYDRDCGHGDGCVFGPPWSDVDANGCDTRNDVLARDLTGEEFRPGTDQCLVLRGTLTDPYLGRRVEFTRYAAAEVHIDHVVALAEAYRSGAAGWSQARREAFANDPRNLLAVRGVVNQAKSDAPADEWLPPRRGYHCSFARIVITVKDAYQLSVTPAEAVALRAALNRCPDPAAPGGP